MKNITAALWAEFLKVRRTKLLPISFITAAFFALVMGFLMFVLKNPDIARQYGLIAAKAAIAGKADWPSFFHMLVMAVGMAGMIGFGFLASWIFGREYADRTFKDLLALPVSRHAVVAAKFIVLAAWCVLLALILCALSLAAGLLVGLEGWVPGVIQAGIGTYAATCILTIVLVTVVAFFACFGRGYLPALGFMILAMILAQIVAVLGYGQYFPWAVPMLVSGAAGDPSTSPGAASYVILFLTSAAGVAGTFAWWRFADQA
jgi:ABC-2 type transport system permease protein